jgi:hypothetical protein
LQRWLQALVVHSEVRDLAASLAALRFPTRQVRIDQQVGLRHDQARTGADDDDRLA